MKILIVDDHPIVRAGLKRLLSGDPGAHLREAATAKDALASFKEDRPDLVILDLNLPGTGGLEALRRLMIEDASARILVFSVHGDPVHATRAFEAGALGYVTKNAPPDQILLAIARVGAGQTYIEPEIAQEIALTAVRTMGKASPAHPLSELTGRDLEILRLLGEGYSLLQIADAIGLSYKTVANNCSRMKAKLGLARTADLIRLAVEQQIAAQNRAD